VNDENALHILWTNADPLTSEFMVMMYATNAMLHGWFREVTVIIWGGTAKLAAENPAIREKIRLAMHAGVRFSACVACAEQLGVKEKLLEMGIEVIPWGAPLTKLIKEGGHLITV
jgi:hypothetical protein